MAADNPIHNDSDSDRRPAIELARAKLNRVFGEPDARAELTEASEEQAEHKELSRHQKFMLDLKASGKSIAQIQTDWHDYYQSLDDVAKREVWQEFYERAGGSSWYKNAANTKQDDGGVKPAGPTEEPGIVVSERITTHAKPKAIARARRKAKPTRRQSKPAAKSTITKTETERRQYDRKQLAAKHNLQSLAFGLGVGLIVVIVFMFSFFNERFIVPFIRPGSASATPIILNPASVSPTKQPEIIIPKINLEIPLVFDVQTTSDSQILTALENGVVHYPTTVLPGQPGNSAYFGHSSNNIFSPGKYKFAFTLLDKLAKGDIFYITYNKKIYVYKVFDRQIVAPSDVAVLNNIPGRTTATLITCDPPGTSLNRLVVWGEQISPAPSVSSHQQEPKNASQPKAIVGNGPSLWERIWPF